MLRIKFNIYLILLFSFFICPTCFAINISQSASTRTITIGILVPLQHKALDEMVDGFSQEIQKDYQGKVNIVVKNSQGDINIQRSILQEFTNSNVELVVPIGTTALQMAVSVVGEKPILGLAANFTEVDRQKGLKKNIANVLDEIPIEKQLEFAIKVQPHLQHVALVYSCNDKSLRDTADFLAAAKKKNIVVQKLMIQQLSELYTIAQQIDKNNQAIFIEKDHMVVSGINTLSKIAAQLHIPIISADDGSVQNGAAFAIGVSEKQIGVEGAKLATQFFNGTAINNLPIIGIKKLYVFINPIAAKQQGVMSETVERIAKQNGIEVIKFNQPRGLAK